MANEKTNAAIESARAELRRRFAKLDDVNRAFMEHGETIYLTTHMLPKGEKRGRYNKKIDAYEVEYYEKKPPLVYEPVERGRAAGRALALAGREFNIKDVHRLAERNSIGDFANMYHVFRVVADGEKNDGKVQHYGTVPTDFKEYVETLDREARKAYEEAMDPEALFARWRTGIIGHAPEAVEYVDVVLERFKAEIVAELVARMEAPAEEAPAAPKALEAPKEENE